MSVVFSKVSLFFLNFAYAWHLEEKTARQRRAISIANGTPFLHASGVLCVLKGYAVSVRWN